VRFHMFSDRADLEVEQECKRVGDRARDREKLPKQIHAMCERIAEKFPEVWDTEPQWAISDWFTEKVCEPRMWQPIDRWEW
jgi:hypothetical protein